MAQSDFTEAMSSAASGCEMECEQPVQFTNVMTGGLDYNRYLYHQLKCSMQPAGEVLHGSLPVLHIMYFLFAPLGTDHMV